MKKVICISLIFWLLAQSTFAQINLVGTRHDFISNTNDLVKWEASDTNSLSGYPINLQSWLLASSVFNARNSTYYITGNTSTASGILAFNTLTNIQTFSNFTSFSNITEIDMSTGKIYNLKLNQQGYIFVNQYDIETGTDSVIGSVYEPGLQGLTVGTTCFNSNDGILYYLGPDHAGILTMFSIMVRENVFTYSKMPMTVYSPGNNFSNVNYDNLQNKIFALDAKFDWGGQYLGADVVEISPINATVTFRADLSEFPYYLAGVSAYHQASGTLIMVGTDIYWKDKLILFNTYSNTYQTGYYPDGTSEIVCDNYEFAVNNYITAINERVEKYTVLMQPNPVSEILNFELDENLSDQLKIKIYSSNGQIMTSQNYRLQTNISMDVSWLPKGLYLVRVESINYFETLKLIKE